MPRRVIATALLCSVVALAACGHHAPAVAAVGTATPPESASIGRGRTVYAANCAVCHGAGGEGGQLGPALHGIHLTRKPSAIAAAIANPSPPMPKLAPAEISDQDLIDVTAYVQQL